MAEVMQGPAIIAAVRNDMDGKRNNLEVHRRHDGLYSVSVFNDGGYCKIDLYPIHLAELAAALDVEIEKL